MTRRDFLWNSGGGLGGIALASLMQAAPHHPAKAKRVVQLQSSTSEESESDSELAFTSSPPSPPRGQTLEGLQATLQVPL